MPEQTMDAVKWSLEQYKVDDVFKIYVVNNGKVNRPLLVDFVRQYFNENDIDIGTFSAKDLDPYLEELGY